MLSISSNNEANTEAKLLLVDRRSANPLRSHAVVQHSFDGEREAEAAEPGYDVCCAVLWKIVLECCDAGADGNLQMDVDHESSLRIRRCCTTLISFCSQSFQ
jgi:hypothetical protein